MAETKTDKLEREYVIPLRRRWSIVPGYKRANKAIRTIKEFLVRHMKIRDRDLSKVRIDKYLNEAVWFRGIKRPPMRIKVKAVKEGEIVRVTLAEYPETLKFKKLREEKREKKAEEAGKKKKAEEKKEEVKEETMATATEQAEKKEEAKEKIAATIEAGKELAKAEGKKEKHTTKVKSPKQEKNQRVGYNQSSRGH